MLLFKLLHCFQFELHDYFDKNVFKSNWMCIKPTPDVLKLATGARICSCK